MVGEHAPILLAVSRFEWRLLGLGLTVAVVVALQPVVPRLHRRQARRAAARWDVVAAFRADVDVDGRDGLPPPVAAAMADVGGYIGGSWGPRSPHHRVPGILFIEARALSWSPRRWLGYGRPAGWTLPRSSVRGARVERDRWMSFGTSTVHLRVDGGEIPLATTAAPDLLAVLGLVDEAGEGPVVS